MAPVNSSQVQYILLRHEYILPRHNSSSYSNPSHRVRVHPRLQYILLRHSTSLGTSRVFFGSGTPFLGTKSSIYIRQLYVFLRQPLIIFKQPSFFLDCLSFSFPSFFSFSFPSYFISSPFLLLCLLSLFSPIYRPFFELLLLIVVSISGQSLMSSLSLRQLACPYHMICFFYL